MPRVPQYDSPQVQEQIVQRPRVAVEAPIEAFGGGKAASQGFNMAENLALKAKERADNIAQAEANTRLNTKMTELMHSKERGLYNKKGKDALKGYDDSLSEFDTEAAEIEKSLVGTQKEAFRQRYQSVRGDFDRSMKTYVNGEMRRYEEEVFKASDESELNKAIGNYRDPLTVSNAIQARRNLILARQKSLGNINPDGTPNEVAQAELDQATSQTHMAVLSSFVNAGDDLAAEKYLKQNEKYFLGEDKLKADKYLEEASRTNKTMRMADDIFKSSGSLNAAYAKTDQIEDGKLRKLVENRVEELFDRRKRARAEGQKNISAYVANILEKTGGDYDAIPATLRSSFSMEDRVQYQKYAKSLRGGAVVEEDDLATVEELENLKAKKAQSEFADIDFNSPRYLNTLTTKTRRDYIEQQAKLRKGDEKFIEQVNKLNTERGVLRQEMTAAGLTDAERQREADKLLQVEIKSQEQIKGKPLTLEEKRAVAADLLTKVKTKSAWYQFKKTKYKFEAAPSDVDLETIEFGEIPPYSLQKIKEYYRSKGNNNPSQEEMLNLYKMELVNRLKGNVNRGNERVR